MKYDNQIFNLSAKAYSMVETSSDSEDEKVSRKQVELLKILLKKFQEQLKSKKDIGNGTLKVKFESRFWTDFNDGYNEIDELVKSNNFDSFASEYCIYLGDVEHRCDEYHTAYYEVIWDYKTYFEQSKSQQNERFPLKETTILPYPVGTYLSTKENNQLHIDKIYQYIIDKDGLGVILVLDVLNDPRLSIKISIDKLLNNWNIYDLSKNNPMKRKK